MLFPGNARSVLLLHVFPVLNINMAFRNCCNKKMNHDNLFWKKDINKIPVILQLSAYLSLSCIALTALEVIHLL